MASVDNPAGRKLLNLAKVPETYGGLKQYESILRSKLASVSVPFRSKPNGALSYKTVSIQSVIAEKFKAAMEEIAKNPNIVTIWGGSFNMRPMNNKTENAKPNKDDRLASNHSLGLAFDMNVDYNPYAKDNNKDDSYRMRSTSHPIVKAFVSRGFSWGGTWRTPDYMHFEYALADFSSDVYIDPDSVTMANPGGGGAGDTGYSFSSGGSSYQFTPRMPANMDNSPNTVYQLASSGERENVTKLDDGRKDQFKSLRESLKSNMLDMGRPVIESTEMYNSSILKTSQSAKQERGGKKASNT